MQAFVDGKPIEMCVKGEKIFVPCTNPNWVFTMLDYRVKEEDRYRPYKNADECFADAMKHGGWVKSLGGGGRRIITGFDYGEHDNKVKLSGDNWQTMESLFEHYNWSDDSPCGVKE